MRALVLFVLFLFCQISYGNTLYSRASECSIDLGVEGKEFKTSVNYNRSKDEQEQLNALRKKLFTLIKKQLGQYPNGLIEQSVIFKNDIQTRKLIGTAVVKPVANCSGKTYEINEDNLRLLSTILSENTFPAIKFTTEHTFEPQIPKQIERIKFDSQISKSAIFGIAIGDSYDDTITKLRRFTLVWPINNSVKMTLIGRNHLFLFEDNLLVHYQYHSNLLPMSLANQLELEAMDFKINLASSSINIKDNLSDKQKNELQNIFSDVTFSSIHHDGETTFSRLNSFSIGEPIEIKNLTKLPCFENDANYDQFLIKNKDAMVSFVDVDNKSALLTGCLQKFVLLANGNLKEIALLDEISKGKANIQIITILINHLKPWTFNNIKHGQSVAALSALGAKIEWQQAVLETPNWHGIFEIYDDAVYSGKIIPLH
ncbi:hypothetical protein AAEU29_11730 [Pseudoalteromonas sp. SSM20]|uniref:hypothetical protein n=1 Tax=Pseudoalteromonas sp. SSM20 TaxID=3139394 RepID=UPI003BAB4464